MSQDAAIYVTKCSKYQINKIKTKHVEPLTITVTPQKAFDMHRYNWIISEIQLTIQCKLTKCIIIIPVPNKETLTVAKAIFENFILIYDVM